MTLSPFIFVLTSLTLAILPFFLNSLGGYRARARAGVYGYSLGFRIFIWLGSIGIALMGFIFNAFGISGTPAQWGITEVMGALAIAGCIYTDRYVVQVLDGSMTYGSFKKKVIKYSNIKFITVTPGRPTVLSIKLIDNKEVILSGSIQYFGDLVKDLNSRLGARELNQPNFRGD